MKKDEFMKLEEGDTIYVPFIVTGRSGNGVDAVLPCVEPEEQEPLNFLHWEIKSAGRSSFACRGGRETHRVERRRGMNRKEASELKRGDEILIRAKYWGFDNGYLLCDVGICSPLIYVRREDVVKSEQEGGAK